MNTKNITGNNHAPHDALENPDSSLPSENNPKNELSKNHNIDDQLECQHDLFDSSLQSLPIGVFIWKRGNGEILKTNPELENILDLTEQQLLGRSYPDLYGSKDGFTSYSSKDEPIPFTELPSYKAAEEGQISKKVLMKIQTHKGKKRWILISSAPIKNKRLEIWAVITTLQDIDTYVRRERIKRENEERLNYALTASDEGLWDYDFSRDIGYLSPRYYEMLGYDKETFTGDIGDWKNLLHPQDKAKAIKSFQDVVQNRKNSYDSVYRLRTKSGEYRWILSRAIVVRRDQAGNPQRVVGTHLDITELRKMEEALRQANKKLEKQVRNKTKELNQSISVSKRAKEELTELNLLESKGKDFIANSDAMQDILKTAIKLGMHNVSNILITGNSGTGKSRLAKLTHEVSKGMKKPFIQINCAALPEFLLEAELFGYEKGAFTGAKEDGKAGLLELANGGTLFLDEIGETPLTIQTKLLKYLDDKEIMHLGGLTPIKTSCTIIAATNADLKSLIKQKKFREDFYFRLNTFPLEIPPLKDRPDDLLPLIHYFIETFNKEYGLQRKISPKALKHLQSYSFPGNTRELKNLLNKAVVLSDDDLLDDIIAQELTPGQQQGANTTSTTPSDPYDFEKEVSAFEIHLLSAAIKKYKTTRSIAAHLNMSQSAVVRRIKKHGLTKLYSKQQSKR